MSNIVPCDDCGKSIDVSKLGIRTSQDRFVCRSCKKKYDDMERMIAMLEKQTGSVH